MRERIEHSCLTIAQPGLSLMELAICMLIISIALLPVVRMIGGPQSTSGNGNGVQISGLKNREAILANTRVDKVLAGDFTDFKCSGGAPVTSFNPKTDLPGNTSLSPVSYGRCSAGAAGAQLYSEWTVLNLGAQNNKNSYATNNSYYQAVLNVTDAAGNSLMVLPLNFFRNDPQGVVPVQNTGVEIAMDRSTSMAWSDVNGNLDTYWSTSAYAIPFMFYRYKPFPTGNSNWLNTKFPSNPPDKVTLNMWNNDELDMVYAKQIKHTGPGALKAGEDPDGTTPNNEAFPFAKVNASLPDPNHFGDGLLGTGDCSTTSDARWDRTSGGVDKNLIYTFLPFLTDAPSGTRYSYIHDLCSEKADGAEWTDTVNKKLSRFEAARTAVLSLLLKLESSPAIASTIELGFFPWGSKPAIVYEAPLQPINSQGFFDKVRKQMLWINRADPADIDSQLPIGLEGGTQIHDGLEIARQRLQAKNYDQNIVVLLTDGQPNPDAGSNSSVGFNGGGLRDYAFDHLGCGVSDPKKRVTLFTVGLIKADKLLLQDMANSTPNGKPFYADDIASLSGIFDSISYQIQKLSLLNTAKRYNINLSQVDPCLGKTKG